MITTSVESPKLGKETHYLKMRVGDENIWRTLYIEWFCLTVADSQISVGRHKKNKMPWVNKVET